MSFGLPCSWGFIISRAHHLHRAVTADSALLAAMTLGVSLAQLVANVYEPTLGADVLLHILAFCPRPRVRPQFSFRGRLISDICRARLQPTFLCRSPSPARHRDSATRRWDWAVLISSAPTAAPVPAPEPEISAPDFCRGATLSLGIYGFVLALLLASPTLAGRHTFNPPMCPCAPKAMAAIDSGMPSDSPPVRNLRFSLLRHADS